MMSRCLFAISTAAMAFQAFPHFTAAAEHCPRCGQPKFTTVVTSVLVPGAIQQPQQIPIQKYQPVYGNRTVMEFRKIPITKTTTRECIQLLPETRYRTVCYTVCKPIWKTMRRESTELVSEPVVKTGMRTVCKLVPVPATRTVCKDEGHWETDKSGCQAWVAKPVTKKVRYTNWESRMVKEQYEYTVFETRCEKRSFDVRVACGFECETRTREVPYTVMVPTKVTKTFPETTYHCVPIQRKERYIKEPVRQNTPQQKTAPTQKMVPQKVVRRVAVPCECDNTTKLASQ